MKTDHVSQTILDNPDVVLIGGGIMSATLGIMLRRLNPELTIQIIEGLPRVALESSNAWNNAGTGHAALCELNYTAQAADGSVDISKAAKINEQFETSKHFWGWLVEQGIIADPQSFIRSCPHMSFVWGEENVEFLRKRHAAMSQSHFFQSMEFSTDLPTIGKWAPLLLEGRTSTEPIAATREPNGTDVNYGLLTTQLINHLKSLGNVELALETKITNLTQKDGGWSISLAGGKTIQAGFVFIGAGGGALPLLQKSGIPEGKGFGGFPVSGQFLVCNNQKIVEQHGAKVYGKAAVGAPPMSVPHLDTRIIGGHKSLLFGPYAGFSPKYLKSGSNLDLFKSVKPDNLGPMLAAGRDNMPLTKYLINECRKSHTERCDMLRGFFPAAKDEEWKLIHAGQRVQIIKKDAERTGTLQFGTEVVASADGSLSTVLGASPGASTAVSIILQVLEKCFPKELASNHWKSRLAEMVPAYGINLAEDTAAYAQFGEKSKKLLQI
ncbi:malate dehydrogenase (quinone) [Pontiellaceae bacterium B1224]|nr:malate dehydrogenase (quinone) [Pontiellaceae bacterium B1224]